jgi:branched-chain amino acid aminotransferase
VSHDAVDDPRNADVLVWLNDRLVHRRDAVVSVLDAGFLLGDGIWESFRVLGGRPLFVERHLDRLEEGLKAIDLDPKRSRGELRDALLATIRANGMDRAHVRMMITRGPKRTPYQGRSVDLGTPTLVVLAEHKDPAPRDRGLHLVTVHVRRGAPDVQDPGWNSHSKLNCVTAAIQAEKLGADEALMLDPHGFVATCNSTHFFVVKGGTVRLDPRVGPVERGPDLGERVSDAVVGPGVPGGPDLHGGAPEALDPPQQGAHGHEVGQAADAEQPEEQAERDRREIGRASCRERVS